MYCTSCGKYVQAGTPFCPGCGADLRAKPDAGGTENYGYGDPALNGYNNGQDQTSNNTMPGQAPYAAPGQNTYNSVPEQTPYAVYEDRSNIKLKEFAKKYATPSLAKNINILCIVLYFAAALNLGIALINGTIPLDAVFLLGIGLWEHITYTRASAITLTAINAVATLILVFTEGRVVGWIIIVVGIGLIVQTCKLRKEYDNFRNNIT